MLQGGQEAPRRCELRDEDVTKHIKLARQQQGATGRSTLEGDDISAPCAASKFGQDWWAFPARKRINRKTRRALSKNKNVKALNGFEAHVKLDGHHLLERHRKSINGPPKAEPLCKLFMRLR